jgi:acetyl esterase/lipase
LNEHGIHAAVLKYRIPRRDPDDVPIHRAPHQDAQRALRTLRSRAKQLGINSARIGVMGFSAGAHLAAVTSTQNAGAYAATDAVDGESAKPSFTILIYGAYMDTEGRAMLSKDIPVAKDTPPAFLVHTADDHIPVESSFAYASACRAAGVPFEIHVFPKGGHGYGLRTQEPGLRDWPKLMLDWIRRLPA